MWDKIISNFDKYNREARVYPTIISSLPGLILYFYIAKITTNIVISAFSSIFVLSILVYFATDIVRNIGKYTEKTFYKKESLFPTTEFLLHKNHNFSKEKKESIYEKIKRDYNIKLSSEAKERNNEPEARKKITEAVGLIRQKMRNNPILLQRNIRYGFWRNLVSVSIISFFISTFCAMVAFFIFENDGLMIIECCFSILSISLWIYKEKLINFFGIEYTEQFYLEYLSDK